MRILRAVDRARAFVPLRALLRFLRLSPSRFYAWRRLQHACALHDQSSCPHTSPHRLTPPEVRAIKDMVTALEYRHVPTGTLAVLAQRLGEVWASPSTWYLSLAKTAVARLSLTIANTSRQEPSRDTTETSYADAEHVAVKRRRALTDGCSVQTRSETLTSRRCPSGGCASFVAMVQSAHFRERDHAPFGRRLNASRRRRVLL